MMSSQRRRRLAHWGQQTRMRLQATRKRCPSQCRLLHHLLRYATTRLRMNERQIPNRKNHPRCLSPFTDGQPNAIEDRCNEAVHETVDVPMIFGASQTFLKLMHGPSIFDTVEMIVDRHY